MWMQGEAGSKWMDQGSTCWGNGCADTVGFSCTKRRSFAGTPPFQVRPGELLTFATSGPKVRIQSMSFAPRDVALIPLSLTAPRGTGPWKVRAPDAEATSSVFVRGADGEGDSSYALCLKPPDARRQARCRPSSPPASTS